jgi:hypothetical protein
MTTMDDSTHDLMSRLHGSIARLRKPPNTPPSNANSELRLQPLADRRHRDDRQSRFAGGNEIRTLGTFFSVKGLLGAFGRHFSVESGRGVLFRSRRVRGVEPPITLLDPASPFVPRNRDADMAVTAAEPAIALRRALTPT